MYKKIEVKFEQVPTIIESLKGESGLYIFHTKQHTWYIGETKDFRNRFVNGYLKGKDAKQHIDDGLLQRIELGLDLSVVFVLMDKELIKKEETRVIGKACPWLNEKHNPRESIRAIQRQIGKIVEDSKREWSYDEMKLHLFYYYSGQIATKRIEEALANKEGNLSKYCRTVPSKGILKPKKKPAA
ncbi:GIY-YIG nuclease family protein [Neobacillus pocheonensis]|uniref:GIY-YIG nuclease family protein n=1 Tax=Neobacillus pocheonensis TaxID=363869 RepID=UPI003D2B3E7A